VCVILSVTQLFIRRNVSHMRINIISSQFIFLLLLVSFFLTGLVEQVELRISYGECFVCVCLCSGFNKQSCFYGFVVLCVVSSAAQDLIISQQYIWGKEEGRRLYRQPNLGSQPF